MIKELTSSGGSICKLSAGQWLYMEEARCYSSIYANRVSSLGLLVLAGWEQEGSILLAGSIPPVHLNLDHRPLNLFVPS